MAMKKPKLPLPRNEREVNEYITALAEAQIAINRATAKANEKMHALETALMTEVAEYQAVIKERSIALYAYFEANRDVLTDGGKRESCEFATGVLGQRKTPPRTQITDEEAVVAYVVDNLLTEFYATKTVLRRDVMLANKDLALTVPGVAFVQELVIYVKPDTFDVEITLKKKVEAVS